MVKGTGCSFKGPKFNSQHQHGGPQLSLIPVSGDLIPFPRFCGHTHGAQDIFADKIAIYIKINKLKTVRNNLNGNEQKTV